MYVFYGTNQGSTLPSPNAPNKSFPQTGWSWMTNWPSMTRHSAKSLPRRPLVLAMSTPGGCFTNTPQALQKYTHKKYKAGNHLFGESLKPKSRVRHMASMSKQISPRQSQRMPWSYDRMVLVYRNKHALLLPTTLSYHTAPNSLAQTGSQFKRNWAWKRSW